MPWIRSRAVWLAEGRFDAVAVRVRGDRIVDVATSIPHGASVIDVSDCYLLPGLIDAHVHLYARLPREAPGRVGDDRADRGADEVAGTGRSATARREAARRAGLMLEAGVTTVRDVGSSPEFLEIRAAWNRRRGSAPWILASGPPVTEPDGHGAAIGRPARGVAAVVAAVEELAVMGADLIKVMATAGGGEGGLPAFSEEELRALVEAAHTRGLKVAAHAHSGEGIRRCVAAGVDSIEHASFKEGDRHFFDEAVARQLSASRTPVVLTPVGYRKAELAGRLERMRELERQWRQLYELGVPIAIGTDVGVPEMDYGTSTPYALMVLARAGIPPAAVLQAAGPVTAGVLGLGDEVGSVAPGRRADLIAVPRDPTGDMAALFEVNWVMSRGLVVRARSRAS